jgi:hypothetical protein
MGRWCKVIPEKQLTLKQVGTTCRIQHLVNTAPISCASRH